MKKIAIIAISTLLFGCSALQSGANSATENTTSGKMKACLMTEANSRYQAGTLFTNSVKETATDMIKTCMKNLALQSAGISAETQSTAENIITNLKTMSSMQ